MRITIAERLRPYSHTPGTSCILPGSSYTAVIYPCLIRLHSLLTADCPLQLEYTLNIKGPVKEFTVLTDLEKNKILVWGHSQKGFFRYSLSVHIAENTLILYVEKAPSDGLVIQSSSSFIKHSIQGVTIETNETTLMPGDRLKSAAHAAAFIVPVSSLERLSLGNHKAQDWDLVRRRQDLREVLPIWSRIGELVPTCFDSNQTKAGVATLLDKCQSAIETDQPDNRLNPFEELFQAGFKGILTPRLYDDDYQGIVDQSKQIPLSLSPLILLTEGRQLIRRLFIEEKSPKQLSILQHLPTAFHCGRFIGIQTYSGRVDLEWSKKRIRQMTFCPSEDGEFFLHFKHGVKTFRLRESKKSKGQKCQPGQPLLLQKNHYYFFDNFS